MEEPRIAVIKIPDNIQPKSLEGISRLLAESIDGKVFILPLNSEILFGNVALDELRHWHEQVHDMLGLKKPWQE